MKASRLFTDLSVELGFTLPFDAVERLTAWLDEHPPPTVDAFTDEILRAEGLDPVAGDSGLRTQVRALVAKEMGEPEWPPPGGRRGRRHHP
jgi:hypothetical protein